MHTRTGDGQIIGAKTPDGSQLIIIFGMRRNYFIGGKKAASRAYQIQEHPEWMNPKTERGINLIKQGEGKKKEDGELNALPY